MVVTFQNHDITSRGKEKVELCQIAIAFVNRFNKTRKTDGYCGITENEKLIIGCYNNHPFMSKKDVAKMFNITEQEIHFLFNRCRSDLERFMKVDMNRDLLVDFVLKQQYAPCIIAVACNLPIHQISDWLRKRKK